jgi:chromosome segregation ATPase
MGNSGGRVSNIYEARRRLEEEARAARDRYYRQARQEDQRRREEEERRRRQEEEREVANLQKQIRYNDSQLKALQAGVVEAKNKYDIATNNISTLTKQNNALNTQVKDLTTLDKYLKDAYQDATKSTAITENRLNEFNEIEGFQEGYDVVGLRNQVRNSYSQIQSLESSINQYNNKNKDAVKKIDSLKSEQSSLTTQVKDLSKQQAELTDAYKKETKQAEIATTEYDGVQEGFREGASGIQQHVIDLEQASLEGRVNLYNAIYAQNDTLANQKQNTQNSYTTDDQKVNYVQQQLDSIGSLGFYMLIAYYIVVFLSIYFLYISTAVGRSVKILIFLVFVAYPWVIYLLEEWIYFVVVFILNTLSGNVFTPSTRLV